MPFMLITLLTFVGGLSTAQASVPSCSNLYSPKYMSFEMSNTGSNPVLKFKPTIPTLLYIKDLTSYLNGRGIADLTQGEISWHTFDSLQLLKSSTEKYMSHANRLSPAQKKGQSEILLKALMESSNFQKAIDFMNRPDPTGYKPTEYELRLKLLEEFFDILKLLPPEFRPRIKKIPWDQRRAKINLEAEEFTRDFTSSFDAVFAETSGYKDYAEFEKAVRAVDDPYYKLAIQIIDNNQLEVAMRKPENGRYWVPKVGFQNQFVTGSSKGSYDPSYRNQVESKLTGTEAEFYSAKDAELKPKYTTLFTSEISGLHVNKHVGSHYGSDIYYFKKSQIERRLSYTMSDSFGSVRFKGFLGRFIPWERRLLMVPFVINKLRLDNYFFPSQKDTKVPLNTEDISYSSYWEAQIFGRLDLDMVEKFEFQENPPSGEFLKELQKRNIQIFDGRNGKTIPWEPGK